MKQDAFERMDIVLAVTITLVWGLKLVSALDVRLALGSDQYEGNVEIFYNGTWGYICDDGWDDQDARVICRMLGYNASGALAYSNTRFKKGILLDNITCFGSEQSIDQCPHNGWIAQSCNIYYAVRVSCGSSKTAPSPSPSGIDVRLVGGSTEYEGIVEVFYNGSWRIICNYGITWNITEAKVVCRMLGFGSDSASAYCCDRATFLMVDVNCTGEEDSIDQCTFPDWGLHNCRYREIAGVLCGCNTVTYNGSIICQNCPAGQFQNPSDQMFCILCSVGHYQNEIGQSYCLPCPIGQYQNLTGKVSCTYCPIGHFQNITAGSTCTPCAAGQYQNLNGQSFCLPCPFGKYQNQTGQASCLPCDVGQYQNLSGQISCFSCSVGQYQYNTGQSSCLFCPEGQFQNLTGKSSCDLCPLGQYQNTSGQFSCTVCPQGTYQNMLGQVFCKVCLAGTVQNKTGESVCYACPRGTYQNQTGEVECIACFAGTYQNFTGQSFCRSCQPGTFQNLFDHISCQMCPPGSFSNQTDATLCKPCEVGAYQGSSGQTGCLQCGVNKITISEGSQSEAACYTADVSLPISYGLIGGLAGAGFIIIVAVSLIVYFCYRWYKAKALLRTSINSGESAYDGIYWPPSFDFAAIDDEQKACKPDIPVKEGNISDDKNLGGACLPVEMDLIKVELNTSADTYL